MRQSKRQARRRRAARGRVIAGIAGSNRLVAFRSGRHIYAQLVAPDARVLAHASTAERTMRTEHPRGGCCAAAEAVGQLIAQRAKEAALPAKVTFDRSGYAYHGRVRALADGARSGGLEF